MMAQIDHAVVTTKSARVWPGQAGLKHAVRLIRPVCQLSQSANLIAETRAALRAEGITSAVCHHGSAALFDWLITMLSYRGISNSVAADYLDNPLLDRLSRTAMNRSYAPTRGLARIEPTRGMLIAYSTQPNQVAIDGDGRNSPFASALIKELNEPGVEVGALFRRVAAEVHRQTEGRQLPELSLSLLGELYLNTQETDLQAWARLRSSENPADINAFIARYPTSVLVPDARQRLAGLDRERAQPAQNAVELGPLAKGHAESTTERQKNDEKIPEPVAAEQLNNEEKILNQSLGGANST